MKESTNPEHKLIQEAIVDHMAAGTVRIVAICCAAMYLLFTALHLLYVPYPTGYVLSACALASAVLLTVIVFLPLSSEHKSHSRLGGIAIIVATNTILHMCLDPQPEHTINFFAFAVGVGFFVFRHAWYFCLLTVVIVSWYASVVSSGIPVGNWGWFLLLGGIISIAVHFQRLMSARRAAETEYEQLKRASLLGGLSRAEELSRGETTAMLQRICATSAEVLGVQRVGVWRLDDEHNEIRCVCLHDTKNDQAMSNEALTRNEAPRYFAALDQDALIAAEDALFDSRTADLDSYLQAHDIQAMLDAPILIGGKLAGVICHEHAHHRRVFTVHDLSWARSVADLVSMVLQAEIRSQLEHKTRILERLEALGILAGGVAHDFNNLLTVVQGHAELLGEIGASDYKPHTDAILVATERASALAHQMLAYSGRVKVATEKVQLAGLVEELTTSWTTERLNGASLDLSMLDRSVFVDGDRTQLRQILANLAGNAARANATSISVSVESARLSASDRARVTGLEIPAGRWAKMVVADDGDGMSADVAQQVFDPFFTTRSDGTGLGLAAVLGIVRMHNGAISLDTEPGHGSSFTVWLSLAEPPKNFPAEQELIQSDAPTIGQGRILIVDDEQLVRQTTSMMLRHAGYDTLELSGLEELSATEINVNQLTAAVVDLTLKDGDGLDVVRLLHTQKPKLPVVLISGYDGTDVLSRLDPDSPTVFLKKPFLRNKLTELLNSFDSR